MSNPTWCEIEKINTALSNTNPYDPLAAIS